MRLIYGFYLAAGLAVAGFLGWRAISFFPDAWEKFLERDEKAFHSAKIDSTVFDGEPSGPVDTSKIAQDTGLTATLTRLAPCLGIAARKMSIVLVENGELPLYTLNFRLGVPLAERIQELSDSLSRRGFRLDESSERPRTKYPWAARIYRRDQVVAVVRGRSFASPGPGTFRIHVGFWTDSLTVPDLAAMERFPSGILLALKPADFSTLQLSGISRTRNLDLGVLVRLETSLFPVSRQERTRVLLHHDADGIARRILASDSVARLCRGVVVLDGDRGARDPGLASRLVSLMTDRSWWLLDATHTSASRLEDAAIAVGLGIMPQARKTEADPAISLEVAALQAESDGESTVLLKLDSTSAAALATFVPLVRARGIAISPWPVSHRRPTGD